MKFSTTTLSLLALFTFASADANAIPNPAAAPEAANTLVNAILSAAKAKQSAALHPDLAALGAIGSAKPKPTVPSLAGLGIIGVGSGQENWKAQCQKKNAKMVTVITKFCQRGHGGKGGVTVPNKYPSGGMCTAVDASANLDAGTGFGHDPKKVQWCTKIGSKATCKAYNIPQETCMSTLFQVCAKGDSTGKGKASQNGGCQLYRTGKINYSNTAVAVGKNPFYKGWTPA